MSVRIKVMVRTRVRAGGRTMTMTRVCHYHGDMPAGMQHTHAHSISIRVYPLVILSAIPCHHLTYMKWLQLVWARDRGTAKARAKVACRLWLRRRYN